MDNNNQNQILSTPLGRSTVDGAWLGLYLSVMMVAMAVGTSSPFFSMFGFVMAIGVPVFAYWLLRRGYIHSECKATFGEIWLQGTSSFFFGSIIMALVIYVGMRFVRPEFLVEQVDAAIEIYRSIGSPEALAMADGLQQMVDDHLLPAPIEIAFNFIWLCSLSGSILSALLTLIARRPLRNAK